jgi:hypothetical protein
MDMAAVAAAAAAAEISVLAVLVRAVPVAGRMGVREDVVETADSAAAVVAAAAAHLAYGDIIRIQVSEYPVMNYL